MGGACVGEARDYLIITLTTTFSTIPHPTQLTCPVPQDQLSLLRLLSSHAQQVFSYSSSGKEVEFVGSNGEAPGDQVSKEEVGNMCDVQRFQTRILCN